MARGRKTSRTIHLTPAERRTLLAWQRATTIPAGLARRGRIILLLADGMTITDMATIVGISRRFVYNWVQRFLAEGVAGRLGRARSRRGGAIEQGSAGDDGRHAQDEGEDAHHTQS